MNYNLNRWKIINTIENKHELGLGSNVLKTMLWFVLANLAVVVSIAVISRGELVSATPGLLILGSISPIIGLLLCKYSVKKAHRMFIITPGNFQNSTEENLYALVLALSEKAGMDKIPEVAIYQSDDMNAFATGRNRNNALIAFSTALVQNIDEEGIAAVAAHEIGHIANGDMIILTIVQGVVNALVMLLTIPLRLINLVALFSDDVGVWVYWIIHIITEIITSIGLFFANLVVKAFSRKREFEADKLAGMLVGNNHMIHALQVLSRDVVAFPKEQASYAALKINAPASFSDIFSTHPSIERRIASLRNALNEETAASHIDANVAAGHHQIGNPICNAERNNEINFNQDNGNSAGRSIYCVQCGTRNGVEDNFCIQCGKRLVKG